ncbi:MAG: hypothetical protein OXC53_09590 [Rhodobacteraceae bacterium]|nr:hypothetical protein [Paracoccaceae bacterium]
MILSDVHGGDFFFDLLQFSKAEPFRTACVSTFFEPSKRSDAATYDRQLAGGGGQKCSLMSIATSLFQTFSRLEILKPNIF